MTAVGALHVSSIQGDINWPAVRLAGYRIAYIRLTRGIGEVDTSAEKNFQGAIDAGILPGFYHRVLSPTDPAFAPEVQALHFASHLNRVGAIKYTTLAPCVDFEDRVPGEEFLTRFITTQREITQRPESLIYTAGSYVDQYLGTESWMDEDMFLWIADSGRYTSSTKGSPQYLRDHPNSTRVVLHHYGQKTDIPGLTGHLCDVDVTIGNPFVMAGR